MRKEIKCDECKKVIGEIEEITNVENPDPFNDIEITCEECLKKRQNKEKVDYFNALLDR